MAESQAASTPAVVPGQPATMKDIADRVGVSIKSVSRVLNNESGVSAKTAERILEVSRELGFRRNDLARGLRRRTSDNTIGVVAQHTSARFFVDLIRGIEQVAAEHDALMLTATTPDPETELAKLLALSSRRMDALIIVPRSPDQSFLRAEQAMGLPLVFVDQPPSGVVADTIIADNEGGAREATAHLVGLGHRRIGVIGSGRDLYTVRHRVIGHRMALADAGVADDDRLVRLDCTDEDAAAAATRDLLASAEPPTALFALSNRCAVGTARALRQAGRGHEVALIGFDDFDTADLFDPPLTVVAQDIEEMGRIAARRCLARLAGEAAPPETIMLGTRLVVRESGEIPGPHAG
ncbi:LacI family DNA-binding transcriptional regulator [Agromyces sp. SYSU T0242]|uniref:LacI family DNA-binding transcriptional regulator n=1 Tax=Agromyces litoreus TaxID=3158561 RepID=UPI003396C754